MGDQDRPNEVDETTSDADDADGIGPLEGLMDPQEGENTPAGDTEAPPPG